MEKNMLGALSHCALFKNMSSQEIVSSFNGIGYKVIYYAPRDVYAVAGCSCNHTDIVLWGEMSARMTGLSGRQIEIIRVKEGETIGPCFLFSANKRLPTTIEVVSQCVILRLSTTAFMTMIDRNKEIRWNFIRMLSDLSTYLVSKIRLLSLMSVKEKIMFLLSKEVASQGSKTIVLNLSRQRMADMFAIQKFSLLRGFSELVKQGIITVKGRVVTVVDIKKLAL